MESAVNEEQTEFIQTRGSKVKNQLPNDFKVITYKSHKSKKTNKLPEKNESVSKTNLNQLNMKRAKFEIVKFGMSGFDPEKKEEAKVQLAIKLGAKPPKNKYKNYKLLLEEKKKQKEDETKRLEFQQLGKNKLGKANAKGKSYDRKRRKDKGILDVYGVVKPQFKNNTKKK